MLDDWKKGSKQNKHLPFLAASVGYENNLTTCVFSIIDRNKH